VVPILIHEVGPGSSPRISALLLWLQLETLPGDPPADTGRGYWWVAYCGDRPGAFCGMYPLSQDSFHCYLCRAGVVPEFRGQGLQRRLIQARIRKARSLGFTSLVSDTVPNNPVSNNNLIACGFRMFTTAKPWCGEDGACYWIKPIKPYGTPKPPAHRAEG